MFHWSLSLIGALVAQALLGMISPHVGYVNRLTFLASFLTLAAAVLLVAYYTPKCSRQRCLGVIFGAICVLAGLNVSDAEVRGAMGAALVGAVLLTAGCAAGGYAGHRIEQPGHLLLVALLSSVFDVASVFGRYGVTAQVVARPEMLSLLAISWPMLGSRDYVPMLGFGDLAITSLYLSATRRTGLGHVRSLCSLGLGYVAVAVALVRFEIPMPALPFLGLAMLLGQPAARALPPQDRRVGMAGLLLAAMGCTALMWWTLRESR
ncbi:MAG: hypothetical protein AAF550_12545 [Myxococcota bacterium]